MAFINPSTSGALSSTLNSLIHSTSGTGSAGQTEEPRAAMVFTSDLRQDLLANRATLFASLAPTSLQSGVAAATRQLTTEITDVSNQLVRALPAIVMQLNPNSIEFDQPKRYTRQDTQKGTVFHHFTNDKGQNNDILTIRFQGNTGNIWRRGRDLEDRDKAIQRLKTWHNLYQLTREPVLLSDGTANVFYVSYVSPLFPVPINFEGFFSSVLKFSENARKPNSRDYSMEFIVRATNPDMNTVASIILDFVSQEAVATPVPTSQILTQ